MDPFKRVRPAGASHSGWHGLPAQPVGRGGHERPQPGCARPCHTLQIRHPFWDASVPRQPAACTYRVIRLEYELVIGFLSGTSRGGWKKGKKALRQKGRQPAQEHATTPFASLSYSLSAIDDPTELERRSHTHVCDH